VQETNNQLLLEGYFKLSSLPFSRFRRYSR